MSDGNCRWCIRRAGGLLRYLIYMTIWLELIASPVFEEVIIESAVHKGFLGERFEI